MRSPIHHRLIRWLAICMFALQALVPAAVRALVDAGPSAGLLVPVCSASGTRWVHLDDGASRDASRSAAHGDHCPLCSLHADVTPPATPVRLVFVARPVPLAAGCPVATHRARAPPDDAPPRAPPLA